MNEKFEEEKIYKYTFFVNITIIGSTFEFYIIDTCDTLNTRLRFIRQIYIKLLI